MNLFYFIVEYEIIVRVSSEATFTKNFKVSFFSITVFCKQLLI